MRLRTDHIVGAFFILVGIAVLALSGDLPTGSLASPGAGMMPKLVTGLMILFGIILVLRASGSEPLVDIGWSDLPHAVGVVLVIASAVAAYQTLGFVVTMTTMVLVLLVGIERRDPLHAAIFSVGVTAVSYFVFARVLKAPLEPGIFRF
jgi:putative tricarboxylic transport membrane protein